MKPITVYALARHRGAKEDERGAMSMEAIEETGLPCFGGCQSCGESLAAYNAYPSKTGYLRCRACIGDLGYATVEEANTALFTPSDDEEEY